MGIAERRLRQKEEVRNAILEAAWDLIIAEGVQSLSIRKIADAIEYSVPVIYDHFENKDAILLEFTRRGFVILKSDLEVAKAKHESPADQLKEMALKYWEFAFNNREYYQLMYGLGMPSCDTVKKVPELQAYSGLVISTIQDAILTGKNPGTNAFLKFHTYWSIMHGLISINMMGNVNSSEEMNRLVLDDAISGFIKGLVD